MHGAYSGKELEFDEAAQRTIALRGTKKSVRCNKCGGAFQKPILANVSSGDGIQTYYACPHCLAKVNKMKKKTKKQRRQKCFDVNDRHQKVAEKFEKP